jgi:hypothetical protein
LVAGLFAITGAYVLLGAVLAARASRSPAIRERMNSVSPWIFRVALTLLAISAVLWVAGV